MNIVNMKIGPRLGTGFGLILMLMATLIAVGLMRLASIGEITSRIIEKDWVKAEAVSTININTRANAHNTMELLLETDKAAIATIHKRIETNKKIITEAIETLGRLVYLPEGKILLSKLKEDRAHFVTSFSKVDKLIGADKRNEATSMMLGDTLPALNTLQETLNRLLQLQTKIVKSSGADAKLDIDFSRNLMIRLGLAALLIGIAFAYWITRSLTRPIKDAVAVAQTIAAGDLTSHIEVKTTNETGQLLQALKEMKDSLVRIDREHMDAEAKNQRLSRLYNVLSQCNKAIVRCNNEQALFTQICRNVVTFGRMKLALIWLMDEQSKQLRPVASSENNSDYLDNLQLSVSFDDAYEHGPSGMAFHEDQPFWCQDFQHDPATAQWHEIAAKLGWRASAALPLHRNGVVIGTLSLYADEINAFDEAARNLLIEMAVDIDYALHRFALEAEQQRSQEMGTLRVFMRELITSDISLKEILVNAALTLESFIPGCLCSILLLDRDGSHLRLGAAPSLPDFYNTVIDGLHIGAGVGSCGNTVFTGARTIVADISHHPYWSEFASLAEKAGLGACWSEPILSAGNKVLGAFAIYHRTPFTPSSFDIQLVEMVVRFIANAIESKQAEASLRRLTQAVEQSANGILITDLDANLEYANAAFLKNTGYNLAEIIGKNPRLHQSDKTPRATYDDMWAHLRLGKNWQGEFINRRKDGSERIDFVSVSPIRETDGRITHYLAIEEDITEKKCAAERIQHLAHFDALTGLPNRAMLDARANSAFSLARRSQSSLAVMFLDLDHFKNINDSLGHRLGDTLLIELSKRLRLVLREHDTIARLGGDEFILLIYGPSRRAAEQVAQKLMEVITQPCQIAQYDLNVTASIGIALYPDDGADLETLSRNADTAMYHAKHEGRNGYCFFTQEMQAGSERHLVLVNALRHALERQQLHLHYQPQVSLPDGQIIGAEALLRWQHPILGSVSPAEFIPVAEDSGLILSIGEWVLRTAVQQAKAWQDSGLGPLVMAVNLSAVQFRHANLPDLVMSILDEVGLSPEYLELELTEGVAMHNPQGAIAVMNNLHEQGVRMSIDDFGTGYSSLNYLKKFKVYKLKIDQSFVRDISTDAEDKAIVSAIISMAKSLGLQTIAEGVETTAQLAFLHEQGCNEAQGYHYSKPLPAAEFEAFIRKIKDSEEGIFSPAETACA